MKKILLLSILVFGFVQLKAQKYKQSMDSVIIEIWDGTKYKSYSKAEYRYDTNCLLSNEFFLLGDFNKKKFTTNTKTEITRDAKGNIISSRFYKWRASKNSYYLSNLTEHTYDLSNNQMSSTQTGFDTITNQMVNIQQIERKFNTNNQIIQFQTSNWDRSLNKYIFTQKNEITTDSLNLINTTLLYSFDKTINSWYLINKTIFAYDSNSNKIKETIISFGKYFPKGFDTTNIFNYSYDHKSNLVRNMIYWKNNNTWYTVGSSMQYQYDYNPNGSISTKTSQKWNENLNKFINYERVKFDYDLKNNSVTQIVENWFDSKGIWLNYSKLENIRDTTVGINELILPFSESKNKSLFQNKLNQQLESKWDNQLSTWTKPQKTNYYYSTTKIIAALNKIDDEPMICLFPNPASDKVYIQTKANYTKLDIKIYSILGEVALISNLDTSGYLDVSNLKKGLYIVQMFNDANLLVTKKLQIL